MLGYIEYIVDQLGVPMTVFIGLVVVLFFMNLIGEFLEFKGKVVPEFVKIRKYFKRKKTERETLQKLPETLAGVESMLNNVDTLLNTVDKHYNADNITKRNDWMNWVNNKAEVYDTSILSLNDKLDRCSEMLLSIRIESMRNEIISFASYVIDSKNPVTHEQFSKIFKTYTTYEKLLSDNNMTNGEADIAMRIIREAYEDHMREHNFIENTKFGMD